MRTLKISIIVFLIIGITFSLFSEKRTGSLSLDDFSGLPDDDVTLILYANYYEIAGESLPKDEIMITFGKIKKPIKAATFL